MLAASSTNPNPNPNPSSNSTQQPAAINKIEYLPDADNLELDLTADPKPCCDMARENFYTCSSNAWQKMTWLFNQCLNKVDAKVKRGFGRKLSADDVTSAMLLMLSVFEAVYSSRVWTSARAEFGISAIITFINLIVDRKNYNEKFAELSQLQLDLIKALITMPGLIKQIDIKMHSADKLKVMKGYNCGIRLLKYWDKCSELTIRLHDGQSIRLHNLNNMANHYAQFNNAAIGISWFMAFINIAFDLFEVFVPKPSVAHAVVSDLDGKGDFAANFTLDFNSDTLAIPILGNYALNNTCDDGQFSGEARLEQGLTSNHLYHLVDRAATILGGIPYRSIANWITTYLLQQQITIRDFSKHLAGVLEQQFKKAKKTKLIALQIPIELLRVLDKTDQEQLEIDSAKLSGQIEEYNKSILMEQGRQKGIREAINADEKAIIDLRNRLNKPVDQQLVDLTDFNDPLANELRTAAEQAYAKKSNLPG